MNTMKNLGYWVVRIIPAVIMAQTLYFKFSGSAESIYIFSTIGMEPWGRIGTGVLELVAAVLLLVNATAWIGAALGFGLMVGAIGMHLTILGISVPNEDGSHDGGYLFMLAVIVAVCCTLVLAATEKKWKGYLRQRFPKLS